MQNNEAFGRLMYFLTKDASKYSFSEFLEDIDVSQDEYEEIKTHLKAVYNIDTYV